MTCLYLQIGLVAALGSGIPIGKEVSLTSKKYIAKLD